MLKLVFSCVGHLRFRGQTDFEGNSSGRARAQLLAAPAPHGCNLLSSDRGSPPRRALEHLRSLPRGRGRRAFPAPPARLRRLPPEGGPGAPKASLALSGKIVREFGTVRPNSRRRVADTGGRRGWGWAGRSTRLIWLPRQIWWVLKTAAGNGYPQPAFSGKVLPQPLLLSVVRACSALCG